MAAATRTTWSSPMTGCSTAALMLIHGQLDISGPADVAWLLHQAWPGSELHLVRTGHQGSDEMTERMMAALSRFART